MLRRTGILEYFGALVFGDDVVKFKPHPEPYLMAAAKLEASRPLVVEDSETGAASGRAAGFEVLRIMRAEDLPGQVMNTLNQV